MIPEHDDCPIGIGPKAHGICSAGTCWACKMAREIERLRADSGELWAKHNALAEAYNKLSLEATRLRAALQEIATDIESRAERSGYIARRALEEGK